MTHKPTESNREFLENLVSAFEEMPASDEAALRESLLEAGVDVDAVLSRCLGLVKSLSGQQRLLAARQKLDRIRATVVKLGSLAEGLSQRSREELAQAFAGAPSGSLVQAYFRKLETVTQEDLASLTEDLGLIEFLEKIEREVE
jgi:hypothetical protein